MNSIEDLISECEARIEYRFQNKNILKQALTHSSCANTHLDSNERLEFLGDAVLGQVVSITLFRLLPLFSEGDLSRVKSVIVSRKTCRKIAVKLGLDRFLRVGKGVGTAPDSLVSNVLEAVIGAILIDGGYESAKRFVALNFEAEILAFLGSKNVEKVQGGVCEPSALNLPQITSLNGDNNFKAQLQTRIQRENSDLMPEYLLLDEKGPAHQRCFKIAAKIGERVFQAAWGNNKKETEQNAAQNALAQLDGTEPPYVDGE